MAIKKNIAIHSKDGVFLSKQKINYARPVFWSGGSDQFSYDSVEEEIFISTNSSKGFQYSRLDRETGKAERIFESTMYWDVLKIVKIGSSIFFLESHDGEEKIHLVKPN